MSGVKKCHMMEKNTNNGNIQVQIVGPRSCVETCIAMVTGIINGDHSSIGHATDILPVDVSKVNGLMGPRGQTVTILKDLTGAYLDIQQGPQAGVPAGAAQVFIAGLPEKVSQARTVVSAFLAMMDHLPQGGDGGMGGLGDLGALFGGGASGGLGGMDLGGLLSSLGGGGGGGGGGQRLV